MNPETAYVLAYMDKEAGIAARTAAGIKGAIQSARGVIRGGAQLREEQKAIDAYQKLTGKLPEGVKNVDASSLGQRIEEGIEAARGGWSKGRALQVEREAAAAAKTEEARKAQRAARHAAKVQKAEARLQKVSPQYQRAARDNAEVESAMADYRSKRAPQAPAPQAPAPQAPAPQALAPRRRGGYRGISPDEQAEINSARAQLAARYAPQAPAPQAPAPQAPAPQAPAPQAPAPQAPAPQAPAPQAPAPQAPAPQAPAQEAPATGAPAQDAAAPRKITGRGMLAGAALTGLGTMGVRGAMTASEQSARAQDYMRNAQHNPYAGMPSMTVTASYRKFASEKLALEPPLVYGANAAVAKSLADALGRKLIEAPIDALHESVKKRYYDEPKWQQNYHQVVTNDPILSETHEKNPEMLAHAFETIKRFSPSLAKDRLATRSLLRHVTMSGGEMDFATMKLLAETEKFHRESKGR